jgi:hypothetical protein
MDWNLSQFGADPDPFKNRYPHMRSKPFLFALFISMTLITGCGLNQGQSPNHKMAAFTDQPDLSTDSSGAGAVNIYVSLSPGSIPLDFLVNTAESYVAKKDKAFQRQSPRVISVDNKNNKRSVEITFSSDFGKPYWFVCFDSRGKVSGYETGISRDASDSTTD